MNTEKVAIVFPEGVLTVASGDGSNNFAVIAGLFFAVSIPLGLTNAMFSWNILLFPAVTRFWQEIVKYVGIIGSYSAFLGILFLFLSISVLHGVVFLVASLVGVVLWFCQSQSLRKIKAQSKRIPMPHTPTKE